MGIRRASAAMAARSLCCTALIAICLCHTAIQAAASSCPSSCPALPSKQRSASALAVSMVVFMGCQGDVDGAARAVASSASKGDLDAFTAGLTIGAMVLANHNNTSSGQIADLLTNTFTVANAANRTIGVASSVGGALAAVSGSSFAVLANETVKSINDLVSDQSCTLAATTAIELYLSLRQRNATLAVVLLAAARAQGTQCWVRRLNRIAGSAVFTKPLPSNACTRRMQQASAMAVSLVTATTCGLDSEDAVRSAAIALVTAARSDNCTFASAVATSTMSGLPAANVSQVYTAAITKAGLDSKQSELGNAFAAAAAELSGAGGDMSKLLAPLVTAVGKTISVSGCSAAAPFVKGMYMRLLAMDPSGAASLQSTLKKDASIAACKFGWRSWV